MMYRTGRMKRVLAAGMLAVVLLSGCGSTASDLQTSAVPPVEEAEGETEAKQLENQLISIWNLGHEEEDQIASDASLEEAASFFLDYVLQNPRKYLTKNQKPSDLDGMLTNTYMMAFVYDGELPAVQAGKEILTALYSAGAEMRYRSLQSICIVYGQGEKGSVWLALAFYPEDSTTPAMG